MYNLGAGSNLLIRDLGYDGLLIHLLDLNKRLIFLIIILCFTFIISMKFDIAMIEWLVNKSINLEIN